MDLNIDRNAASPVTQQLVTNVTQWIKRRRIRPGARLPSIRQLAQENGLSLSSVIKAYDQLVAVGVLESRHGSGFFVAETRSQSVETHREHDNGAWELFGSESTALKLGCGWLPESWREGTDLGLAIRQVVRSDSHSLFNYSSPLGSAHLRQHIQKRLSLIDLHVEPHQIITTQGASHGLDLLVRTLLKPGDLVLVESPGYYNLFNLLKLHGIKTLAVPRTQHGPDIASLEAILSQHSPSYFFINSMYQNPTGTSLAPSVAYRLLQLATQHDFRIIEDDIYADFQNGTTSRLANLDALDRVIYLASFSKTLTSSLRVGYVVAQPEIINRLAEVKMITGLGCPLFAENVVATLLANGSYRKLIQRLRQRLNKQMANTLRQLDDAHWEVFSEPTEGMFVWARPRHLSAQQVNQIAEELHVQLSPGSAFMPEGQTCDWLRLNVAYAQDIRAQTFFQRIEQKSKAALIRLTS
ncbi:PLP-dependent aminotransferase family protein [Pseudomonas sp. CCI3.2]|uniref:aminotransferase-like domain-containing protein n=1 Tax=unclassified Pseudomonas TaxID=196821 RepID=UPI002AC9147F|nr:MULTISPECIES: PLP-dependent aminotransferase family protein [unclassified Pseudomonas]MEB0076078.1 PLP-dependent aminotransferase family protein [Pseudomonas sp. MH10out]MEB0090816.1 PLP-dependent aminotransferase family protein [Pseudomonas sp. CCI4.2]MEB0100121.1 PLP-dependent aminotransferase family protein [Pseudomonas sp. CCI3.2]MEB0132033.1 PLP-dependent aminotransferase family protein [Pseudomonas sp. CCI2.4]MEB0156168.1 PLP-dependent aminotransferase family protein [Pseudomonas sp. 